MSKTYYPVYKSSSGDVGVGTTSPTLQSNYRFLQVNGSVSAVIEATVGGTRIGGFDSTSSVLYVGTIGSYPVVFRTAVDEKMRISANGNIGIGTSSPAYKLDVNTANDSAIRIRNGGGGANNGLALSVGSGSPWLDITEGVEFRIKGNTYANIGTWNSGNNTKLLIDSNGNIGIGTSSPGTKLNVVDSSPTIRLTDTNTNVTGGVYGAIDWLSSDSSVPGGLVAKIDILDDSGAYGDRGAIRFFTNNATSLGERMRIASSGNVGIGTTNPGGILEVYGATSIFRNDSAGATTLYLRNWTGGGTAQMIFGVATGDDQSTTLSFASNIFSILNYGDPASSIQFGTRNAAGVGSIGVTINPDGNVGIGTTSPSAKLHVSGSSTALGGLFNGRLFVGTTTGVGQDFVSVKFNSGGTYSQAINIVDSNSSANNSAYLVLRRSDDTYMGNIRRGSTDNAIYVGGNSYLALGSGDTERVRIDSSGNVGVGTTSPTKLLHLYAGNDYASVRLQNTAAAKVWDLTPAVPGVANSGFSIYNLTDTIVPFHITNDGNIGIGTTSPSQKLDVNGTVKATSYLGDFKGRLVRTSTTQTITGNVALTIDVSAAYIHIITVQASGGTFGITGITYNNRKTEPEVDEIILIFKWPATGSGVINVSNIIGDTPAFNYGKATAVRLTSYKGTGGLWICEQIASNMDYTNL